MELVDYAYLLSFSNEGARRLIGNLEAIEEKVGMPLRTEPRLGASCPIRAFAPDYDMYGRMYQSSGTTTVCYYALPDEPGPKLYHTYARDSYDEWLMLHPQLQQAIIKILAVMLEARRDGDLYETFN